jgi:hypothetical protein
MFLLFSLSVSYPFLDISLFHDFYSLLSDIDLLRDDSLVLQSSYDRWKCVHCQNQLNIEEIENRLVYCLLSYCSCFDLLCSSCRLLMEVSKVATRFFLQDFYCPKTHFVSNQLLSIYSKHNCEKLKMNFSSNEMKKQLFIFLKIASIYSFDSLACAVNDLLLQNK